MNVKMYTAAREATTRARNVASAIQQVQRQVNDDNKDISQKVDKNEQIRSKRKAELELGAADTARKLAAKQAFFTKIQAVVGQVQALAAAVTAVVGKIAEDKDKKKAGEESANKVDPESPEGKKQIEQQKTATETVKVGGSLKQGDGKDGADDTAKAKEGAVKAAQEKLAEKGAKGADGNALQATGKFDAQTTEAVKKFQTDNNLKVTGEIDAETAKKLSEDGPSGATPDPNKTNKTGQTTQVQQPNSTSGTETSGKGNKTTTPQGTGTTAVTDGEKKAENPGGFQFSEDTKRAAEGFKDGSSTVNLAQSGSGAGRVIGAPVGAVVGGAADVIKGANVLANGAADLVGKGLKEAGFRGMNKGKSDFLSRDLGNGQKEDKIGGGVGGALAKLLVMLIEQARKAAGFEVSGGMFEGIVNGAKGIAKALTTDDKESLSFLGKALNGVVKPVADVAKAAVSTALRGVATGVGAVATAALTYPGAIIAAATGQGEGYGKAVNKAIEKSGLAGGGNVDKVNKNSDLTDRTNNILKDGKFDAGDKQAFEEAARTQLKSEKGPDGKPKYSEDEIKEIVARASTSIENTLAGRALGTTNGTVDAGGANGDGALKVNGIEIGRDLAQALAAGGAEAQKAIEIIKKGVGELSGVTGSEKGSVKLNKDGSVTLSSADGKTSVNLTKDQLAEAIKGNVGSNGVLDVEKALGQATAGATAALKGAGLANVSVAISQDGGFTATTADGKRINLSAEDVEKIKNATTTASGKSTGISVSVDPSGKLDFQLGGKSISGAQVSQVENLVKAGIEVAGAQVGTDGQLSVTANGTSLNAEQTQKLAAASGDIKALKDAGVKVAVTVGTDGAVSFSASGGALNASAALDANGLKALASASGSLKALNEAGIKVDVSGGTGTNKLSFGVAGATGLDADALNKVGAGVGQFKALKAAGLNVELSVTGNQVGFNLVAGDGTKTALDAKQVADLGALAGKVGPNGLAGVTVGKDAKGDTTVNGSSIAELEKALPALKQIQGGSVSLANVTAAGIKTLGALSAVNGAAGLGLDLKGATLNNGSVTLKGGREVSLNANGGLDIKSPGGGTFTITKEALAELDGSSKVANSTEQGRLASAVKAGLALADSGAASSSLAFDPNATGKNGTADRNNSVQLTAAGVKGADGKLGTQLDLNTVERIATGKLTAGEAKELGIGDASARGKLLLASRGVDVSGQKGVTLDAEFLKNLGEGKGNLIATADALGKITGGQGGQFAISVSADGTITAGSKEGQKTVIDNSDAAEVAGGTERGKALLENAVAQGRVTASATGVDDAAKGAFRILAGKDANGNQRDVSVLDAGTQTSGALSDFGKLDKDIANQFANISSAGFTGGGALDGFLNVITLGAYGAVANTVDNFKGAGEDIAAFFGSKAKGADIVGALNTRTANGITDKIANNQGLKDAIANGDVVGARKILTDLGFSATDAQNIVGTRTNRDGSVSAVLNSGALSDAVKKTVSVSQSSSLGAAGAGGVQGTDVTFTANSTLKLGSIGIAQTAQGGNNLGSIKVDSKGTVTASDSNGFDLQDIVSGVDGARKEAFASQINNLGLARGDGSAAKKVSVKAGDITLDGAGNIKSIRVGNEQLSVDEYAQRVSDVNNGGVKVDDVRGALQGAIGKAREGFNAATLQKGGNDSTLNAAIQATIGNLNGAGLNTSQANVSVGADGTATVDFGNGNSLKINSDGKILDANGKVDTGNTSLTAAIAANNPAATPDQVKGLVGTFQNRQDQVEKLRNSINGAYGADLGLAAGVGVIGLTIANPLLGVAAATGLAIAGPDATKVGPRVAALNDIQFDANGNISGASVSLTNGSKFNLYTDAKTGQTSIQNHVDANGQAIQDGTIDRTFANNLLQSLRKDNLTAVGNSFAAKGVDLKGFSVSQRSNTGKVLEDDANAANNKFTEEGRVKFNLGGQDFDLGIGFDSSGAQYINTSGQSAAKRELLADAGKKANPEEAAKLGEARLTTNLTNAVQDPAFLKAVGDGDLAKAQEILTGKLTTGGTTAAEAEVLAKQLVTGPAPGATGGITVASGDAIKRIAGGASEVAKKGALSVQDGVNLFAASFGSTGPTDAQRGLQIENAEKEIINAGNRNGGAVQFATLGVRALLGEDQALGLIGDQKIGDKTVKERSEAYKTAVANGDFITAQKLLDEASVASGLYAGTFKVSDLTKDGRTMTGAEAVEKFGGVSVQAGYDGRDALITGTNIGIKNKGAAGFNAHADFSVSQWADGTRSISVKPNAQNGTSDADVAGFEAGLKKQLPDNEKSGWDKFASGMGYTFDLLGVALDAALPGLQAFKKAMEELEEIAARLAAAEAQYAAALEYAQKIGLTFGQANTGGEGNGTGGGADGGSSVDGMIASVAQAVGIQLPGGANGPNGVDNSQEAEKTGSSNNSVEGQQAVQSDLLEQVSSDANFASVAVLIGLNPGLLIAQAQQSEMLDKLAETIEQLQSPFGNPVQEMQRFVEALKAKNSEALMPADAMMGPF